MPTIHLTKHKYTWEPDPPYQLFELVDNDGKLAIASGYTINQEQPEIIVSLYLFTHVQASDYAHLIGRCCELRNSNFSIWNDGRWLYFDSTGCEYVHLTCPVPRPRNVASHDWVWFSGAWHVQTWSRCLNCYRFHNPAKPCKE